MGRVDGWTSDRAQRVSCTGLRYGFSECNAARSSDEPVAPAFRLGPCPHRNETPLRSGPARLAEERGSAGSRALPEGVWPSPQAVAREIGVGVDTLERWCSESLSRPTKEKVWTAAARFEAVIVTAAMDEAARNAWCRENGVYPQQLQQAWHARSPNYWPLCRL